jgi:Zn finger protein HypA/HybF involved in hydrogenase expression
MRALPIVAILLLGCGQVQSPTTNHFPLEFAHAEATCTDCHGTSSLDGLDSTCAQCHEAVRPAGHYTGDCGDCHSAAGWDDADFDHRDFFPTPHEGVRDCGDCHPVAGDRSVFTCTDCHAHQRADMEDEHRGETSNFRYESGACLDCHPDGRE